MARLYNGAERPNRCVYCYITDKPIEWLNPPLQLTTSSRPSAQKF
ncbi:hypothetical protein [Coleofasciculus chthonoplastes]